MTTGVLRTGALVVIAAFAAAALAGPADASKISDTRAQVRAIEQQLNAMDIRLEASIQAYDGAQQHLTDVRHQIQQNTIKLRVAKHNLKVSRAHLAVFMVNAYKGTDVNDDPAAYVLGAGSFTDLITRVEDVQRIGASEHALLKQVTTAELEISTRQAQLKSEERDAAKLVAQKRQQKAAIEAGLRQRRALLSSTKGELGHLLHERQVHQQQAAAAAAAALAQQQQQQQQAQQAPPPSSGGGTGSSGGGSGGGGGYNPPPAGTLGQQAAAIAQQYLGVPYVWGGASPSGFDCSGLVVYVYGRLGVSLPHYTVSLWNSGAHVSRDQLAPGDLVFFYSLDHVGIYLGGGLFIHAPHTGTVVQISSLNSSWYSSAYDGAVRISG
ncbi:MAG TPA: NlpC/P60 family protein [Gaiellales bacterium]|nr:NlpC/P60 family protein [Gaiellales bacterium]